VSRTIERATEGALVAVSDTGETIALARENSLTIVDSTGERNFGVSDSIRDLRFRPGSSDYIYTGGATVTAVYEDAGEIVLVPYHLLPDVRFTSFSPDGRYIVAIDASGNELLLAKSSGELQARLPLPCSPSELEPANNSSMRFHCADVTRMHVVDLSGSAARVLFVPEPIE
jgi:hypothetical protein